MERHPYHRPLPEQPAEGDRLVRRELDRLQVLLDAELAALYGVSTKRFNEQVHRNRERFPADFMCQLSAAEYAALRSQIATSKVSGRGGRRYLPYALVLIESGLRLVVLPWEPEVVAEGAES